MRNFLFSFLFIGLPCGISVSASEPASIYAVHSGTTSQTLNGDWSFRYVAGSDAGSDTSFHETAFSGAASWKTISVPSHWELKGFAPPSYGKAVPEGFGLYRRTFWVPAEWRNQRTFLRFDGVLYGFDVWVNGKAVGSWASGYNPVTFDITDVLLPDATAENIIAVRVTTRAIGWEFDCNDDWALSGIYRDVTLFAAPAKHLADFSTHTTLRKDGHAALAVNVQAESSGSARVKGRLLSMTGDVVGEFTSDLDESGKTSATMDVEKPSLWTAETPSLYRLELALYDGEREVHSLSEKIGLREVTIEEGVLKLNGRPIKLHGADHHDMWPEVGRATNEELMRKDLELMRAGNLNFIRTSHYPPNQRFIEMCDELGMYVMDEVPFGYGDEHLTDPAFQENLYARANATVRRDHNRPSVIIWSVGNENPNTPLTLATAKRVKELDPTRPVCFPQVGSYFAKSFEELPEWVDIYAPHYPELKTVKDYAGRMKRPVIFTEFAHALGLASDRIEQEWAIMESSPRLAGGAVWMFQDQGLLRTREEPLGKDEESLDVWLDANRHYDTHGNEGMDGILYSDRTPQVDYWEVRKVFSPVRIAGDSLAVTPGAQSLTLPVSNHFDFRSLDGFSLSWDVRKNGTVLQKGSAPLHALARTAENIAVPVTLPVLGNDIYTLTATIAEEGKAPLYERSFHLLSVKSPSLMAEIPKKQRADNLRVDTSDPQITKVIHPGFSISINKTTGGIIIADPSGKLMAEGPVLHAGRRFTEAERLRSLKTTIWNDAVIREGAGIETEVASTIEGVRVHVRGTYKLTAKGEQALEGDHTLLVKADGSIEVNYSYTAANGQGSVIEAGMSLLVPEAADEFHWIGAGPFAGYPGKEALNEFGIFQLNRNDLRFQGNRRHVEVAALTSSSGAGIALTSADADIAVENLKDGTLVSHNAVLSGRGNKGAGPEFNPSAAGVRLIGRFTIYPLSADWPLPLKRWLGPPGPSKEIFHPYYRSYDQ